MALSDRELWAIATSIERQHGKGAPLHIAERIGTLALAGDMDGVLVWKGVAARLDLAAGSADPSTSSN